MGTVKRAFLYVTRKKGKSVLLFFVLLIMATFVLSGLSIEKASQAEQKNLRQSLGGVFELMPEFSEKNPYYTKLDDGDGGYTLYTERPLTQEIIDAVAKIEGIKKYDASTPTLVSTNLEVFPGNVPMKDKYNDLVYARTVSGTENNSYFESGTVKLVEGSHITPEGSNAAVISKDLAEKNNLKLGDTISLHSATTEADVNVKITGIYEILKPDSPLKNIITYDKIENQIFIDFNTFQKLMKDMPAGFMTATFTVDDPARLDDIIAEVKNISSVDWRAYAVTADNSAYIEAAAPLEKLQTLVTSMILVIALVSAVILALILTMWGRTRIHETGVFLSLGIRKTKIIGQYLLEVLMIALIAFSLSYFTSNVVAGQLANGLLQQNVSVNEEKPNQDIQADVKDGYGDDISISVKDSNTTPAGQEKSQGTENEEIDSSADVQTISVTVGVFDMLQLYLIGFAIITLSVVVSSGTVMRLKPREILSKMS